jgi:hypothetical protein
LSRELSTDADLATLKLQTPAPPQTAVLEVDDRSEASVSSDSVVLIGYPTGIESLPPRPRWKRDHTQKWWKTHHEVTQIVSRMSMNFAMLNEFGSNLAVPVRYADELLK